MNYSTIANNSDRKNKARKLFKDMLQSGKNFNDFVMASVHFFYHDGAKQINIANDLLKMAQRAKGMNATRLASFLKVVIPHELVEGNNSKNSPPRFSKKDGKYMDYKDVEDFLSNYPEWFKFGKNEKTSAFDLDDYLTLVAKKIEKEHVTIVDFNKKLAEKVAALAFANVG